MPHVYFIIICLLLACVDFVQHVYIFHLGLSFVYFYFLYTNQLRMHVNAFAWLLR